MTTIPVDRPPTDHLRLFHSPTPHRPLSAILLVAALAILTAASLTLLASIALNVDKIAHEAWPTLAQCGTIATDGERLACFDQLGKQALGAPAKGANAPLLAR